MNRYRAIPTNRTLDGARLYKTVKYPLIPRTENDIYVITVEEDRYDRLAQQYYNDSSLWWVVSTANAEYAQGSLYPPIGVQIRIPGNLNNILVSYNALNK
jgi:hypothetical protein